MATTRVNSSRTVGWRLVVLGMMAALILSTLPALAANPGQGTTDTGQALSVEITNPVDGASVPEDTLTVEGTANIGALAGANANVLYIVDVSGSTDDYWGNDCNGDGSVTIDDDFNGNGSSFWRIGEVIDCEIAGVIALNESLFGRSNIDVGLIEFQTRAYIVDVDPISTGIQTFITPPEADLDNNGVADIEEAARTLDAFGGTNFNLALSEMNNAFATQPAGEGNVAYFLSDGESTSFSTSPGSPLDQAAQAGTEVNTFSIGAGATGCGSGAELNTIADTTGGTCTEVDNPAELQAALGGAAAAGIDRVEVSLNGAAPVPAMLTGNDWTVDLTGLVAGPNTIAATVFANDAAGSSATAEITVNVNTPPAAGDDDYSTDQDTPLNIAAPGVLANDSDNDGDSLSVTLVDAPSNASVTLNSDGSFDYTPNAGFTGTDSFTYVANDGSADSNVATVTITVNAVTPVNTPPTASDDDYSTDQDTLLNITAPGVLANDSDNDGDSLTVTLVDAPSNGSVTLNSDGSFDYTPNAGFAGTDSFTYVANDGSADSNVATVTITVDVAIGDQNINALLALIDTQTSYNPGDSRTPGGAFTIRGTFQNQSSNASIEDLYFVVTTLTNNNLLLNADSGPNGEGAQLSVAPGALGSDGVLSPGETFTIDFEIGLQQPSGFTFFVDAFGTVTGGASPTSLGTPLSDGGFEFEIGEDDLQPSDDNVIYLPLIIR